MRLFLSNVSSVKGRGTIYEFGKISVLLSRREGHKKRRQFSKVESGNQTFLISVQSFLWLAKVF